jgi:hypothetical protein
MWLIWALLAEGQLSWAGWSLVGSREILDERFLEIMLGVDLQSRQAVEPCPSRSCQHERRVVHHCPLVAARNVDRANLAEKGSLRMRGPKQTGPTEDSSSSNLESASRLS